MYKSFLIKYAEIAIKGKNRYLFEDALVSQINHALKKADGEFLVRKEQGRIYVDTLSDYDYDEVVEALKCVFGIVGICPVVLLEDEGFDKLAEEVISYIDKVYPDKHFTFKVNARRARKNYPMESMEINAAMGEKILDAYPETKVDVIIHRWYLILRSVQKLTYTQRLFRDRVECRSERTAKQCCFYPAGSTVRWLDI